MRPARTLGIVAWLAASVACPAGAMPPTAADIVRPPDPAPDDGGTLVLDAVDLAHYRRIFRAQADADWAIADRHIAALHDPILLGHVLAQRYLHPTGYTTRYDELQRWMERYADHPQAHRIRRLALKRKPDDAPDPPPVAAALRPFAIEPSTPPPRRTAADVRLLGDVRSALSRDAPDAALRLVDAAAAGGSVGDEALAEARRRVATGLFGAGRDMEALAQASQAALVATDGADLADWVAGLAAWRLGRRELARSHFETVAMAAGATPWVRSAGAFWAARVHGAANRPAEARRWWRIAARETGTFYALLAAERLGEAPAPVARDAPSPAGLIARYPEARRAAALLQLGLRERAGAELARLAAGIGSADAAALGAMLEHAGRPDVALRLGARFPMIGEAIPSFRFPLLGSRVDGLAVDDALALAVAHRESGFRADAVSPAGARGMMQLMPATAREAAGSGEGLDGRLDDGMENMAIGSRHLAALLARPSFDGRLYLALAAYNAGAGRVERWLREIDHRDDALLFIEAIPVAETRIYIERVLSNLWLYRRRLGQETPSLAEAARGDWPRYRPLDADGGSSTHGAP